MDDPVDEDSRQMHLLRIEFAASTITSAWAMHTRPAIAASGLKFIAALLKTRLPAVSATIACTSEKSAVIDSSST